MKRYRVLHPGTGKGGELNAENGPQACKILGLNYKDCLWIRLNPTKGYKPTKYYKGRQNHE